MESNQKNIVIEGRYASAIVFTTGNAETAIDSYAVAQIRMLCDNEASEGSRIRIMPDVHPGKVGTIGLTMTVTDRILPQIVGVDIGCGITAAGIRGMRGDYQRLDTVIRDNIPAGSQIHRSSDFPGAETFNYDALSCGKHIQKERADRSLGTLGGGNHFIEVDMGEDGSCYLLIHTGSRHLGQEVTEFYMREGQARLRERGIDVPYELTWLDGSLMEDYLHDLEIVQQYAALNRGLILRRICKGMKWKIGDQVESVHNYAETMEDGTVIIRKGAIAAYKGKQVVIPVNMRDGAILGTGLGNPEWNYSAPHGSGRLIRRDEVKTLHTVSEFRQTMKGIYSSSVGSGTLDEAPFAYRGMKDIADAVSDTVEIREIIKPVYNYKAGSRQ